MKNLNSIYLSLGSNIGDRADNLTKAIVKLSKKMKIVKSSSIYETEPLLFENQNSLYLYKINLFYMFAFRQIV